MMSARAAFAYILPAVAIVAFAGCALPARFALPERASKISVSQLSEADQLLAYALQAGLLLPADFLLEKERARAEFIADKSSYKRVKLAMLIALSPPASTSAAATADDSEIQGLVEPIAFNTNPAQASDEPAVRGIAALLLSAAQERKRLREQLRDTMLRSQANRRDEISAQTEARILRTQVEELEKKLSALKSIERSVNSRSAESGVK